VARQPPTTLIIQPVSLAQRAAQALNLDFNCAKLFIVYI
jgi:hypothetical protein